LRTFGEIGIISDKKTRKIRGKQDDRGLLCVWIGYPTNHGEDMYKFMDLNTKKISMSRSVIWLNKNYAEFKGITAVNVEQITPIEVDREEIEAEIDPEINKIEDSVSVPSPVKTPAG
jgi:hypothetical protein